MSGDLQSRRLALIQWAQSCLDSGDWHGLSDAAMDLLVADARLQERAGRDAGKIVFYKRGPYCVHSEHFRCSGCIQQTE